MPFEINDVQLQEHKRGKKNIFCQIWHIEKEKRKMKMMITDDATPYRMKEIYPNNKINATTKKSKNSLSYSFKHHHKEKLFFEKTFIQPYLY